MEEFAITLLFALAIAIFATSAYSLGRLNERIKWLTLKIRYHDNIILHIELHNELPDYDTMTNFFEDAFNDRDINGKITQSLHSRFRKGQEDQAEQS